MCEGVQFPVSSNVEESARCVVRASREGVAVGEEPEKLLKTGVVREEEDALNSVDVGLVAGEGLGSLPAADIPQLRSRVAGTGHKNILVRTEGQTDR